MRFNVKVDQNMNRTFENVSRVLIRSGQMTDKYADRTRDIMREQFSNNTHNSTYGSVTPIGSATSDPRSIGNHGLVKSRLTDNKFRVGAKEGSAYGSTYAKIFGIITEGRTLSSPVTFKLPQGRESASDNGFWTVQYVPPNPFVKQTMDIMRGSEGQKIFKETFEKEISKTLRGG